MYLAFAVEYIGNPLMFGGHDVTLTVHGASLALSEIHRDVALLAAATMLPVSLLTAAGVRRAVIDAFGARSRPT
jgi:hypothetical protein